MVVWYVFSGTIENSSDFTGLLDRVVFSQPQDCTVCEAKALLSPRDFCVNLAKSRGFFTSAKTYMSFVAKHRTESIRIRKNRYLMRRPGIEPGLEAWKASVIAIRPSALLCHLVSRYPMDLTLPARSPLPTRGMTRHRTGILIYSHEPNISNLCSSSINFSIHPFAKLSCDEYFRNPSPIICFM